MSKKILGLLLVLCLVVGLLPVAALADAADGKVTIKFGFTSYKLTGFDTPIYTINTEEKVKDTAGNEFTRIYQTTTGATEENYNAKIVWKTGEEGPTIYLRNFIFDEYNEEADKWKGTRKKDSETGETTWSNSMRQTYGISTTQDAPTKIVLQGTENVLKTRFGLTYKNKLTIVSENDAKFVLDSYSSGISTMQKTDSTAPLPSSLVVDANLDITVQSFYGSYASHALMSFNGDITINGGNLNLTVKGQKQSIAINAYGTERGNIIINGGKITANSVVGLGNTNGAIRGDKVTINGGEVNINPSAVGIQGDKGIEINGGIVNITTPYYALHAGTDDSSADVVVNGGTTTLIAQNAFSKPPILGDKIVTALAGANLEEADYYEEDMYSKPFILLSDKASDTPVTKPTDAPTEAPTQAPTQEATQAPTQEATQAPTQEATQAPTQEATQAPTQGATQAPTQGATQAPTTDEDNPGTGDSNIILFTTLLFVAVFGVVATVAFSKKNSIVE